MKEWDAYIPKLTVGGSEDGLERKKSEGDEDEGGRPSGLLA